MFKKPVPVAVTHDIDVEGVKELYDAAKGDIKEMLKVVAWALAIGIPLAILFGVAANVAGDVISANMTDH